MNSQSIKLALVGFELIERGDYPAAKLVLVAEKKTSTFKEWLLKTLSDTTSGIASSSLQAIFTSKILPVLKGGVFRFGRILLSGLSKLFSGGKMLVQFASTVISWGAGLLTIDALIMGAMLIAAIAASAAAVYIIYKLIKLLRPHAAALFKRMVALIRRGKNPEEVVKSTMKRGSKKDAKAIAGGITLAALSKA